ncbi:CoxG family protein [Niallia nealsonii]|uniref:SRPBCC family protein n=1 Tax=Niallia nealsonii TaxID=115979 RepID=A0A2N0Z0D4_9BACI|nr:SRPBCC family protein [Niallia nealsonii]PKG22948.1 SRPBCC family protein [Niallia nealsonii]
MPQKKHNIIVKAKVPQVWNFVCSMDNWAPLVPGYIDHQILCDKVSTWEFKTDFGLIKKKIQLRVDILTWQEPSKITFQLTDINEKFIGNGYFLVEKAEESATKMTGFLKIEALGTFAAMMNSILEPKLEELTEEFTKNVCQKIESLQYDNNIM